MPLLLIIGFWLAWLLLLALLLRYDTKPAPDDASLD